MNELKRKIIVEAIRHHYGRKKKENKITKREKKTVEKYY